MPVCLNQFRVGICPLWILVQVFHVGVGWSAIEIEVVLLDILTVVAFAICQAKQALLKDRILPIPQRQRKAEPLLVIADPAESVFAPSIGPRTGLIMRQVIPRITIRAVILSNRSPLPFA